MRLLFVNACMRGPEVSRTHALCRAFLEEARKACPGLEVQEHDLTRMNLQPVTAAGASPQGSPVRRPALGRPAARPAYAFAHADAVLIGAPYWDLSFPAALKVWVENVYVRNLTFRYTPAGEPVGLAGAGWPCTFPPPAAPWGKTTGARATCARCFPCWASRSFAPYAPRASTSRTGMWRASSAGGGRGRAAGKAAGEKLR